MGFIGIGKLAVSWTKLLWEYWYIIAFLTILLPPIAVSINSAYNGEDWAEPLREAGMYMASQDLIMEDYVQEAEFNPTGNLIDYYFNFWVDMVITLSKVLWVMVFTFIILFKMVRWSFGDKSADRRALFITIIIMAVLQMLVDGVPFKGLYHLVEFIITEVIL